MGPQGMLNARGALMGTPQISIQQLPAPPGYIPTTGLFITISFFFNY